MRPAAYFFALTTLAASAAAADMTITLNEEGEVANIATDENAGTLTVAVKSPSGLSESVTIGNATFDPLEVRKVVLCRGCEPTYFIPAHDRSSNYGATTGLVLWASGCCGLWWSISILPLEVAGTIGPDAEGITSITDAQYPERRFNFRDGFLIEDAQSSR